MIKNYSKENMITSSLIIPRFSTHALTQKVWNFPCDWFINKYSHE